MSAVEISLFFSRYLSDNAKIRVISKLNEISLAQPALIRIRPLTLRTHFLGPAADQIDAEIASSLLHFEMSAPNLWFSLSPVTTNKNPALVVLIVGTPRTGNSITRMMVGAMGFTEYAVHSLSDLSIDSLESRCVIQCHTDAKTVKEWKKVANVRVVTLARHPLDVLESMRKYMPKNIESKYWGIRKSIPEIEKLEDANRFYRWAISRDARRLMNLSLDLANNSEVKVIKYEELVSSVRETFDIIAEYIGSSYLEDVQRTLEKLTKLLPPSHITRGGTGAGLDVSLAHKILIKFVYRKLFRAFNY